MKLADQLYEISVKKSEELIKAFEEAIMGNLEEKLLRDCLRTATVSNRTYISLGRNCLPPLSLEKEGFFLRQDGPGFIYCWH